MSLDLTNEKSALVQVMAWYHQATSHYLSQCWHRSMSPNGVTRPQYIVNTITSDHTETLGTQFCHKPLSQFESFAVIGWNSIGLLWWFRALGISRHATDLVCSPQKGGTPPHWFKALLFLIKDCYLVSAMPLFRSVLINWYGIILVKWNM